ncbi:uncharacterized protein LOC127154237 [Labeo rohita]|uniref:uncharacterized protein LOC127154237 n=1 Tax=Labeo rohita TaxID=84645 RepID=UPI0021E236EB|nr:uncharacterized protein LOC127154237 [Labeo rohita]
MFQTFAFCCLCCCCLVGVFADTDAVKSVSVTEGDSVTLNIRLNEIQKADQILWKFGTNRSLIAKINREAGNSYTSDGPDGRFRDRLKLDSKTGSLTITNTRLYKVSIKNSSSETKHRFSITVYAPLPVPVISSNSTQNSSSYCSLVCSVVNVSHVSLSWYKGNSLLSSISVSDLSISLSLPLEVQCLDDSYSCVVAYSFTNQTTHLTNTQLCQPCPDCTFCCHVTEAVTRLVISAVVGVAAAFIMVYDITSRKVEK